MQDNLQQELLDRILASYTKKVDAVEVLCKLLSVSKDAVYRRLRGDTLLTPNEIGVLAKHFGISLDNLILSGSSSVHFSMSAFTTPIESTEDYLLELHKDLHRLDNIPDVKVYYTSQELPIFYYFLFPELTIFKLYVWGRTAWDFDYLKQQAFALHLIPPHSVKLSQEIINMFMRLDTIELWSANIIDNTLNQIEHHYYHGAITETEQAIMLCDKCEELANHLSVMAEHGCKFKPGMQTDRGPSFLLLHNDSLLTNNTIFVDSPTHQWVFSAFGDPSYLVTSDPRICKFTSNWFHKIINKSVPMSNHAESFRTRFFHQVKKKIDLTKKRIEMRTQEIGLV